MRARVDWGTHCSAKSPNQCGCGHLPLRRSLAALLRIGERRTLRVVFLQAKCNDRTQLSLARVELKRSDSSTPVKASGRFVILLRVPECAAVLGIHGHAAVIAPAFEAVHLHTTPVDQKKRRFHGV